MSADLLLNLFNKLGKSEHFITTTLFHSQALRHMINVICSIKSNMGYNMFISKFPNFKRKTLILFFFHMKMVSDIVLPLSLLG